MTSQRANFQKCEFWHTFSETSGELTDRIYVFFEKDQLN